MLLSPRYSSIPHYIPQGIRMVVVRDHVMVYLLRILVRCSVHILQRPADQCERLELDGPSQIPRQQQPEENN